MNLFKRALPVPPKLFILDPETLKITEHEVLARRLITNACRNYVYDIDPPRRGSQGKSIVQSSSMGFNVRSLIIGWLQVLTNRCEMAYQNWHGQVKALRRYREAMPDLKRQIARGEYAGRL